MYLLTQRPFLYSLVLHAFVIIALIMSFDAVRQPAFQSGPGENIVEAVIVDERTVERELQRLQEIETAKAKDLIDRQNALDKQLAVMKNDRIEVDKSRKELATEWERIKQEKLKIEEERDHIRENMLKEVEERKRKDAEEKIRAAENKLETELRLEQEKQDQIALQNIRARIYRLVTGNFNMDGMPEGLECKLFVQAIPGGEVISVTVSRSSGNDVFDRRAVTAVEKSSPLPLPSDPATFERLGLRKFHFRFKPKD